MYKRYQTKRETAWHKKISWQARVLRHRQKPAEAQLWVYLKQKHRWGCRFRRQFPWHNFILDFYCREHDLVIEVDGSIHSTPEQIAKDKFRDRLLTETGYTVCRVTNEEVLNNIDDVLERITSLLARRR